MRTIRHALGSACVVVAAAAFALVGSAGMASADTESYLRLDKPIVTAGETVGVLAGCGEDEILGTVGSAAFAPTDQDGPYEGNGGAVVFSSRSEGGEASGHATIRSDAAPGTYHVGQRCSGGNTGGAQITVLPTS